MKALDLEDEARLTVCRKNVFAFLSLFVLILLTYSNSFHASWHLDDGPNITENRRLHLTRLSWPDIKETFLSTPSASSIEFFRPVSRFSIALNYYLGKNKVFGYHVVNVSIHIIACFFLYLFLFHTLRLPPLEARYGPYSYFVALLATSFWAIHPIQTQAVTYIVQRMASMAGMFYIMAMYFYVKAQHAHHKHKRAGFFISCAAAGLLALGSKENAILLPVSLFLFSLLVVKGLTGKNLKTTLKGFSLAYLLPLLVGLVLFQAFFDVITRVFDLYGVRVFTLWERLLTEPRVVVFYMTLLLYPLSSRLSVEHEIAISNSLLDPPTTLFSFLLILVILAAALRLYKRDPLITFSVLFFFLNHAVESTILPMELVFEHRNYIPSMLFFFPVASGLLRVFLILSHSRSMQRLISLFLALVLIALGIGTFLRNMAWEDEGSLWLDCLEKYPDSFRAHQNLGRYYDLRGEKQNARKEYLRALKARDTHSRKEKGVTYFNLGLMAHERGEHEKAMFLYTKALELDSCCPGAHNNLAGILLERSGSTPSQALSLLDQAIGCKHDTEIPLALSNKGILLWKMGKPQEALDALNRAMEMDPDNPLTLLRLGYVFKEKGHFGKASTHFKRLLTVDHQSITGFLCLAEIYFRRGHIGLGRETLTRLLDTVSLTDLLPYLEGNRREKALTEVTPDMRLLLPYLANVCIAKGQQFQEAQRACTARMEEIEYPSDGKGRNSTRKRGEGFVPPPSKENRTNLKNQ